MTDGELARPTSPKRRAVCSLELHAIRPVRGQGARQGRRRRGEPPFIVEATEGRATDGAILSEEEKDSEAARRCARRACGSSTRSTARANMARRRTDWAVHIALAVDGRARGGRGGAAGHGADALHRSLPVAAGGWGEGLRMAGQPRTRPAAEAVAVAEATGRRAGADGLGAGAKAMAVLRGEADIYLHSGGQYEWDSCAPWPWRRRRASTSRASTAARSSTTAPIPISRTC